MIMVRSVSDLLIKLIGPKLVVFNGDNFFYRRLNFPLLQNH